MTRTLHVWRTAGKPHRCQSDRSHKFPGGCVETIERGDRYCRSALPPGTDLGNTNWWRANLCVPCANFYGYTDPQGAISEGA